MLSSLTIAQSRRFLEEIAKLRKGLAMIRANPSLPHHIELPTGGVINVLDGETEVMLDQMEAMARANLRKQGVF